MIKPLIWYPTTRFRLTKAQTNAPSIEAGILRLERKQGVIQLEKKLADHLENMPQLYLQGGTDRDTHSIPAHLISSTPFHYFGIWWVSPRECKPPAFYKKIFATVGLIADAAQHMADLQNASEIIFSFYLEPELITIPRQDMDCVATYRQSAWLGRYYHAFPVGKRTEDLLGEVRYKYQNIFTSFGQEISKRHLLPHLHANYIGSVYKDILKLMLRLAENNWNRES